MSDGLHPEVVLNEVQQYNVYTAWKELEKAEAVMKEGRSRAKAQEHLREALGFITRTPAMYKNLEFEERYNRIYNIVYRGYA